MLPKYAIKIINLQDALTLDDYKKASAAAKTIYRKDLDGVKAFCRCKLNFHRCYISGRRGNVKYEIEIV